MRAELDRLFDVARAGGTGDEVDGARQPFAPVAASGSEVVAQALPEVFEVAHDGGSVEQDEVVVGHEEVGDRALGAGEEGEGSDFGDAGKGEAHGALGVDAGGAGVEVPVGGPGEFEQGPGLSLIHI